MKRRIHKVLNVCGIILLILAATLIIYISYLLITYKRIEDNQIVEIRNQGSVITNGVTVDREYSIISYNIGFGAYSSDYSFFMDGGEYSRARSKESVLQNTNGAIEILKSLSPDFIFLQEVDLKSTRSYFINQYEMIMNKVPDRSYSFAVNFDSAYLFYPFSEPHGKSLSGMATISKYKMESAIRRSLPISTSFYKFIDLDRCYKISRIPVENGKYLCLYNVHLSAYTEDESIVTNQILMLSEDLRKDYEAGNYIVCGGDFNQDLLGNSPEVFGTDVSTENWAKPLNMDLLPKEIQVVPRMLTKEEQFELQPSCRNADTAYIKGKSFVTLVDGFLISDNIELLQFQTIDSEFKFSDHNPVMMRFKLK